MGYCYSNSDDADAIACGFTVAAADGGGLIKWMVMAQDKDNARSYVYLRNSRRNIALANGFQLITEADTGALNNFSQVIPRDQWFCLQMQIYAHSTSGYLRAWLNDTYLGQHTRNALSDASYKIKEWGIGNIWNGVPYTDGNESRTNAFWMDDVIVATDYPGYGAPLTQDSGGRYFIDPTIGVGDL
jgi:hypothetical protein